MIARSLAAALAAGIPWSAWAGSKLHNDRYDLSLGDDATVTMQVSHMAPQTLVPEFTVLWSETDPQCVRNASHLNYPVAPRAAVRWKNPEEPLAELNAWLDSPPVKSAMGMSGSVRAEGKGRIWEFRDAQGKVKVRVAGERALDTTRPLTVGHRTTLRATRGVVEGDRLRWEFAPQPEFVLAAELRLPPSGQDPEITFTLTPKRAAFFSVAFTGAPQAPVRETIAVPQECDARGHKQFDFVMSEADLHLPRAQVATRGGNVALVADPRECRFRLPTIADARFGFMLSSEDGRLKPVLLAPLLGGPESKMRADEPWRFTFRCVAQAGDWQETMAHIARDIHGFRDQRDNSGPGPINACLEHVVDFLTDRRGGNRALWDTQQKYYDYFTDKTGVFKPFSPLYGLSVAIVTDDEAFFRTRARPAVEYALSRKTSVLAPYDTADNKQANSAGREVGAPYLGRAQLTSLDVIFQGRSPVLHVFAASKPPPAKTNGSTEEGFFDLVDRASVTHDPHDIAAAREAAYANAAKLNLYPAPPETMVTVDRGGHAPVHLHSFGRHRNQWGFPEPQPLAVPEQTVPAWRISRLGLPGIAYPIEYWMNTHGAVMRAAGLAHDPFLRDIARWGMVGRFGNFPGDNRSQDSLVPELADAVDRPPWQWNFATVNAGHAWDFAAQVLDFLVSDAFERSRGAIDFPAESAAGSNFRVRIYGGRAGRFYDDEHVRLWLPRGLVSCDNRQLDWLAGHGNGHVYLALLNQSFREERATLVLDRARAECRDGGARCWRDSKASEPLPIADNRFSIVVPAKGMVALAIPATVRPQLQAKIYDETLPPLPAPGYTEMAAPFGKMHAMLLRAGRGLTSAFVYAETLPEKAIAARLHWRQGAGAWQKIEDDIYPYEFSPELREDAGNVAMVLEVEDVTQQWQRSPLVILPMTEAALANEDFASPPDDAPSSAPSSPAALPAPSEPAPSDDFIAYLQRAANGAGFGLGADGRFRPYSTPQGRRIAWRQPVWDQMLFARGCTREEAEEHLRGELRAIQADLVRSLASRQPAVDFAKLDQRQQETLLDFAFSEGVSALRPEFVSAVLTSDWPHLIHEHLYVRYAGHAPDHPRNKAFAQRWDIP